MTRPTKKKTKAPRGYNRAVLYLWKRARIPPFSMKRRGEYRQTSCIPTAMESCIRKAGFGKPANHHCGDPYGNRTHIFAVRGRRLSRLTKGPWSQRSYYITSNPKLQAFFEKNLFFIFYTIFLFSFYQNYCIFCIISPLLAPKR